MDQIREALITTPYPTTNFSWPDREILPYLRMTRTNGKPHGLGARVMSLPFHIICKKCGSVIGTIISPAADHLAPLKLEFACPDCVEKTAKSKAITLDSETSWGKVVAEIKGR